MAKDRIDGILKMLERLPVPVVIASPLTGRILWVNSQLLGLAKAGHPDQVVGSSILDFVKAQQQSRALADLAKVALGQSPPPVIYELSKLDGETAAAHVASMPMLYHAQPAMLSLVTDVSVEQRLIRDLAESEERYRELLDNTQSGIVVVVDQEVVYANRSLVRALGLGSLEELVGRSMYDFIAEEFRRPVREARHGVIMSGEPYPPSPVELVRVDGTRLRTSAATTRVRWNGELATQTLMHDLERAEEL